MTCPRCARRPAKRACPALSQTICATCCATKRLVEIRCPADCVYLASAEKHPAAAIRRQQEQDLGLLMGSVGQRLSEGQLQLFFLLASVIVGYRPEDLMTLRDADVADAATAMATTLAAAGGGLIAEVAGTSRPAEGLRRQFDALLAEVGKGGGARFAQEAAEVLRGIARGAGHESPGAGAGEADYLALLARVLPPSPEPRPATPPSTIVLP